MLIGAIGAGVKKFVCGVGRPDGIIIDFTVIPTLTPEETL